jgi:fermentation-respiration switch protein FrsA (DUF1100 family)
MACPGASGAALARERVELWVDERSGYGRSERDSVVADILAEWSARGPTDRWTRFYLSYDPLVAARRVRQPALVLQGEADTIVPAGHAELLAHAMRTAGNRDVTVRTFRGLGHAFVRGARALPGDPAGPLRSDLPGSPAGWRPAPEPADAKDLEEPGDPDDVQWSREVLGSIADWLAVHLKTR